MPVRRLLVLARLHDGGMQVEIVRHHRRAEDADGDVEHVRVREDLAPRDEAAEQPATSGRDQISSAAKQTPMVAMSVITSASM